MTTRSTALLIVESPTKAKKIQTFVSDDIEVLASVGHIRDLPTSRLGVNVANAFEPSYEISKEKLNVVESLRKAARKASVVYLASDPDREGESIAWHLYEILKNLPGKRRFYRIRYYEITKSAVLNALAHPTNIDFNLVHAQQARRIIDRLAGYRLSKLVAKAVHGAKSAGRVQSAALRLIVDREMAINHFHPTIYYTMGATLRKGLPFDARLSTIDGNAPKFTIEGKAFYGLLEQADVEAHLKALQGNDVIVTEVERKQVLERPQPPFTTSTLQQLAATRLGYSVAQTTKIAKQLYENGLISYIRTDNVEISEELRQATYAEIKHRFGHHFLPMTPNTFTQKKAATAINKDEESHPHPPIHPIDLSMRHLPDGADAQQAKLYHLIWCRFMASQMAPAQVEQVTYRFAPHAPLALSHRYTLSATTSKTVFKGCQSVWLEEKEEGSHILPELQKGEQIEVVAWNYKTKETPPPRHYSEATLIRELETCGIGRPSTYASTLQTLFDRKYVQRDKGHILLPTDIGIAATQYLLKEIADFVNIDFTKLMEESLDQIAEGEQHWVDIVAQFYQQLLQWIKADPILIEAVLECLSGVTEWQAPTQNASGRITWSDEDFYHEMYNLHYAVEEGCASTFVTKSQLNTLIRMAHRYLEQLPPILKDATPESKQIETETIPELLQSVQTISLNEWETKFVTSVVSQFETKGELSIRQISMLKRLTQKTEEEQSSCNLEEAKDLLEALSTIAMDAPIKRGKRTYDDSAFVASLQRQLTEKHRLTKRQFAALKKLARHYHVEIGD